MLNLYNIETVTFDIIYNMLLSCLVKIIHNFHYSFMNVYLYFCQYHIVYLFSTFINYAVNNSINSFDTPSYFFSLVFDPFLAH